MSLYQGCTSRHCYVIGCANGDYRLQRWQQTSCDQHGVAHYSDDCDCKPPFQLFPFPTEKKRPEARERWKRKLNRADEVSPYKLKEPKKYSRVCSRHFIDGKPSEEHPDPEVNLGHDMKTPSTSQTDRSERYLKRKRISSETFQPAGDFSDSPAETMNCYEYIATKASTLITASKFLVFVLLSVIRTLKKENKNLKMENIALKNKVKMLASQKRASNKKSVCASLLKNDKDATFYTGIDSITLFKKLHNFIVPFVRRRWRGLKCVSTKVRKFVKSPKKFGPQRKLKSEDEFLLTLMWLRLGLLKKDLADRFHVSESLCSQIFNSWLTAMSKVLCQLVFWPSKEQVLVTKPKRYRHLPDLRTIIDCSEIFIETPKDPLLQAATWSDYKHHNTGKFLIAVAPNSSITFCSNVFNGRASDKAITLASDLLDLLDPYDMIQADKGFNIQEECAARRIHLHVPPGKRGQAQMSVSANIKTSRIANLRILVEQVIRRLKSFRIIKYTVPISLVPNLDKILGVCSALCNLKKPIYKE